MSIIEENYVVAPWVGPTYTKKIFSVVVLSSNVTIIEKIATALTKVHAKGEFQWKLIILRSFDLEEIVNQSELTGNMAMDFVILGLDTARIKCLNWTKKVIRQVHPSLRSRRVVLVNASGLSVNEMVVNAEDLLVLQSELKSELLTANVYKNEDAALLARRLLKYMEVSVGIHTGIPNLNV